MAEIKNGLLIDGKVTHKIITNIHHGAFDLKKVKAIVIHQTYSPTAESTIQDWETRKTKKFGAHFLIDTGVATVIRSKTYRGIDGKIYQTANLNNLVWHAVSRDYKMYPVGNSNSIGIEFVAMYDDVNKTYPPPSAGQIHSGAWLVKTLIELITTIPSMEAVFAHGVISLKDPNKTEGVSTLENIKENLKPKEIKIESPCTEIIHRLFPYLCNQPSILLPKKNP